jgi:hypothetical protein
MRAYPVSIWLLPRGDQNAENAVDLARLLPADDATFLSCLESGAVRITVTDLYADVLAAERHVSEVMEWLRAASAATPNPVEWEGRA